MIQENISAGHSARPDREVRPFEPTWLDRQFRKTRLKLDRRRQRACDDELADLFDALKKCRPPVMEGDLKRWRPGDYNVKGLSSEHCRLVEYRLKGTLRVIAAYFPGRESPPESYSEILLVGATLKHDHDRLKRLIGQHRSGLAEVVE